MKTSLKNLLTSIVVAIFLFSALQMRSSGENSSPDCLIDTTRVAVIEFHVVGMDSASVNFVQDVLDTTCGVSFNFACWNDTAVFVEYDSLLTNRIKLIEVISGLGFKASVKDMY